MIAISFSRGHENKYVKQVRKRPFGLYPLTSPQSIINREFLYSSRMGNKIIFFVRD
jgi:hypothetical protein